MLIVRNGFKCFSDNYKLTLFDFREISMIYETGVKIKTGIQQTKLTSINNKV